MSRSAKTVLLATDGRTDVDVGALAAGLNRACSHLRFEAHARPIDLGDGPIGSPRSYERLAPTTAPMVARHPLVVVATDQRYDNNFFYDGDGPVVIVSFWGWPALTSLPRSNGLVGLIAMMLAEELDPTASHPGNTGCINDFLADKRGIDALLRFGSMCKDCLASARARAAGSSARSRLFACTLAQGIDDLIVILDEVSQASKREVDVLARWQTKAGVPQDFDVFLCHNEKDKAGVRELYRGLRTRGIAPWFDEEHLPPGRPWQRALEETIPRIKAAAIVVGPHGQGPWQEVELDAFLREFVRRGCPVIPVLLADAGDAPPLPLFLQQFTWVDFRRATPDPWRRLVWGVTGAKPGG